MNEVDMDFKLLRKREDLEKMVFGMEQEIVDESISRLLEEGYLLSFGPFNDFLFCIFTDCDIEGVIRS